MRRSLLAASALALVAAGLSAAAATAQSYYGAPPSYAAQQPAVVVSIGPGLVDRARRIGIDRQDLEYLQRDLYQQVTRALNRAGPGAPVRADLVIEDAVPNRPTFSQQSRITSLSLESFGLGGASVGGTVTFPDGRTAPVSYRWYETDIRWEHASTTWQDATRAFDQFAGQLRRGDLRPVRYGEPSREAGYFGRWYGSRP